MGVARDMEIPHGKESENERVRENDTSEALTVRSIGVEKWHGWV